MMNIEMMNELYTGKRMEDIIYIQLVITYMHILLALRLLYLLLKDKMATGLLKSIGPNIIIESI